MLDTLQLIIQNVQKDSININSHQSEKRSCNRDEVRGVFSIDNTNHVDKQYKQTEQPSLKVYLFMFIYFHYLFAECNTFSIICRLK